MAASVTQNALERFLELADEHARVHSGPHWLGEVRRQAREVVAQGFPTVRHEEWKYTDPTPAINLVLTPVAEKATNGSADHAVTHADLPTFGAGHRLVFVNGRFRADLSQIGDLPDGVELGSLAGAIENESEILPEHFGRYADQNEVFNALNTLFAQDGAWLRVPARTRIEEPIHVLFWTSGGHSSAPISHPRNLFLLGESASAHVVETYAGEEGVHGWNNAVTEVALGANANFEHVKVQRESLSAFHFGTLQIAAARDVTATSHCLNFGGRLVRNNSNAVMGDSGCEITLDGLVIADGEQHIDNHTVMDHAHPHCRSWEVYAHVLDGKANGVFNGKIFVRPDAQKTDAKQSNRSLLLSRDAQINAKPQLEIFADDVKCTHGATIGELDENALFYLRSRGVPERAARGILVQAFAAEVLGGVTIESLREELKAEITRRLS